jgi:hypothetical protein
MAALGDDREVHGKVTHAFEVRAHSQRGDECAQVAGDRLLTGDQVHGARVERGVRVVDRLITADHALRTIQFAFRERDGGLAHGGPDQIGHGSKVGRAPPAGCGSSRPRRG